MSGQARHVPAQRRWLLLFGAWMVAAVATLGSLFFSEIVGIPVCELCWYQRIAMYPLVLILGFGLFPYDPGALRTAAAIVIIGWLVSVFHLLLVAGVIPESVRPCAQGISCAETHFSLLGFLNIPVLSALTFTMIGFLLFCAHRLESA